MRRCMGQTGAEAQAGDPDLGWQEARGNGLFSVANTRCRVDRNSGNPVVRPCRTGEHPKTRILPDADWQTPDGQAALTYGAPARRSDSTGNREAGVAAP